MRDTEENTITAINKKYQSFYTLANAGKYAQGANEPLLTAIGTFLSKNSDPDDYLLFTGDNVHDNDLKNARNERQLLKQLELSSNFKGTTYFLPGEKDWNEEGIEGLESIEDYIEDFYKEEDHFLPKNGCPLETIDVNQSVELILINSQWYIEDWSKVKNMNDKCELKTRKQFKTLLASEIRKARHKTIIIAMHHPMYTNGIYGGKIPQEVLYRSVGENLFIPVAGSLWSFIRAQGGLSKQDRYNPLMNELMSSIETASFEAPRVIVLSGHERNLQYIDHENIKQIVSGTGSSVKAAGLGKRGQFTSTKPGFSEVRLYEDGSSSVHFYSLENDTMMPLSDHELFSKPEEYNIDSLQTTFPKTMTASVYPPESVIKSEKYENFWGKHYRYVYGVPVEAPVAILDTLYGGLTVERAGGGNQTSGLRLLDKEGREYNMRAIAKDPLAFLKSKGYNDLDADNYFTDTFPAEVIADFYTAAHPYGAFAIPRLAGAVNLPHTHPKLYYVPKQKTLGNFNEEHGNKLYMIVEKPSEDFNTSHMFKYSNEVESTSDLFKELREDEKNKLDERLYIRARIFDMLVGDWDRHEDQWRWAQTKTDEEGGIINYLAIPRDRDQVFAKFDGSFLETMQKVMSGMRQFGNYGPDIPYIEEFSASAINLDRAIIQRSDKSVWFEEVAYIQENITEDIVTSAFQEVPNEIQDDIWKGIQNDLLSRKRNLQDIVARYYEHFEKFVTLKGTDKDDHFIIENLINGDVNIKAYRIKDGELGTQLFDRTLIAGTTENIWIYGLDDKDFFEVKGTKKSPIKIVITGGLDDDTFDISGGKNITIYDQKSNDSSLSNKGQARFHIDNIYENHIYDSERSPSKGGSFGLKTIYNPDEGVSPQFKFSKSSLGFERHPFTTKLELEAKYIALTQAGNFNISWHRAHLFHDWNFRTFGRATTANYTENFFGLGNGSENTATNFDANRVAIQYFTGGFGLYYDGEYGTSTGVDVSYENISLNNPTTDAGLFSDTQYLVASGRYQYHSIDNDYFPTRGMKFTLRGSYGDELTSENFIGSFDPSITLWNAIDAARNLVFKTHVSGQLRFGEDIPFYKQAQLGADTGLRSYRQGRFTGKQALMASIDVAYKFKPVKSEFFPIRTQGYIGYDTGRVWITDEQNKDLHYSYGGGLKFSTAAALHAQINYFNGPEGGRLGFGISIGL